MKFPVMDAGALGSAFGGELLDVTKCNIFMYY